MSERAGGSGFLSRGGDLQGPLGEEHVPGLDVVHARLVKLQTRHRCTVMARYDYCSTVYTW